MLHLGGIPRCELIFRRRVDDSLIQGRVAPGFEEVATEFKRNFTQRGELGAACAIYHQGDLVVDLWGGYRDHKKRCPWQEDTMLLMFSVTKGLTAMCLALAHSRGWLDYDERVVAYWPEFGQQGKEQVTVRQLLSHQAGLCVLDTPLDVAQLADLDFLAAVLASQRPAWEPGTRHGYHAVTLGWYAGELIRRVDPQGRSLGRFLQDELARPLGLEFYVGLPQEVPEGRIATLVSSHPIQVLLHLNQLPRPLRKALFKRDSLSFRAFTNPRLGPEEYNGRAVRSIEMPASNGIGQVRSVAKAYSIFATGGQALDLKQETVQALEEPAISPTLGSFDEILKVETAYSLGFLRPSPHARFGSSQSAYGASGAGGSFAFADPESGVGFAYAMSKLGYHLRNDPREKALQHAFYRCLEKAG